MLSSLALFSPAIDNFSNLASQLVHHHSRNGPITICSGQRKVEDVEIIDGSIKIQPVEWFAVINIAMEFKNDGT